MRLETNFIDKGREVDNIDYLVLLNGFERVENWEENWGRIVYQVQFF